MIAARARVLLLVTLLLPPAVARAADATDVVAGVRVAPPSCPIVPLSIAAFVEALRVELAGRAPGRGTTLVALAVEPCDTSTAAIGVNVSDATSGRGFARVIGLEDVAPSARPRALALAVAELVRAVEPPPESAAPATTAPAIEPPVVATARPVPSPGVLVVATDAFAAVFPSRGTTLWGARLSASGERASSSVGGFLDGATGEKSYADGTVRLQWLGLGAFAGPRWTSGRLTLAPALIGTLAWARIEGHTSDAAVVARAGDAVTAAVRARVLAAWALGRAVSLRAFVEGGWQVAGFDATVDGARAAGISGASLVAGLGLGFLPGP